MIEPCYAIIGQRVRVARLNHGLTMEAIAIQVGVTRACINMIEKGQQRLMLHVALAIADAMGVPVAELLDTKSPLPQAHDPRPAQRIRVRLAELRERQAALEVNLKRAEKAARGKVGA